MSAQPDNPPAFPNPEMGKAHFDSAGAYPGMTLRDWFAGQALAGLLSGNVKGSQNEFAKFSYEQADAMLRAREAKP